MQRASTAVLACEADGPDARAAFGKHTAIAAHRLAAPCARPDGECAAAYAPSGCAATADGDQSA